MSTRARPPKPASRPPLRPRCLRKRGVQAIPSASPWDWKPECEEVVGPPGRRLEDVLARCSSAASHGARHPNDRPRARQRGDDNV
jgi:hypothetical protein